MKKIYILTAVFALLTLSLNAQLTKSIKGGVVAQSKSQTENGSMRAPNRASTPVTVCDGTATNEYVPFWGYYFDDNYQIDQMIYPESLLTDLVGKTITSITFYANANISNSFNSGRFTFKIGTTNQTTFSTPITRITTGMTAVATDMLMSNCISGSQFVIDFSNNPFTYQGGNLVLDYQLTTRGSSYAHTYFYGENNHTNASFYSRGTGSTNSYGVYGTNSAASFLPKVVFGVMSTDPTITAPNTVNLTSKPGQTATETVTVTGSYLTDGITTAISGTDASLFSVSPSSLGTTGGTLTITYSPTAVGSHTATITLSSTGAEPVTITLNGKCANEETICDGSGTNSNLPIYSFYYDNYQKNQMIYPASELTNLVGKEITAMTFYANGDFTFSGGAVTARLATTDQSSYSSKVRLQPADMAIVASGFDVPSGGNTWTIVFDTPFEYNGGNLVVDMEETSHGSGTGSYGSSTFGFYGVSQTGGGFFSYGSTKLDDFSAVYSGGSVQDFLPKVTFAFNVNTEPKIEVSPETLTINDSGTNNTFTVQGSNLGTDNVGVTVPQGSAFSTTTSDQNWGFVNNNGSVSGTVTVTYNGRDLSATETVTAANNLASATVTVTYKPDLYIYCDYGVSPWDFSANPAIAMTDQGDGIYTATLSNLPANSHILFGRASGLTYYWEGDGNRLFIGASTDGGDWGYGDNNSGYLDTDPYNDYPVKYHPIYFSEGGTYTITIDANAYTFTIEKQVLPPPENVVAIPNSENQSATVTWDVPSNLPSETTTVTEQVTETFDDTAVFIPYSVGGISATQHTGAIGDWTLYDPTGVDVYPDAEIDWENEGIPHAWQVFPASTFSMEAHSGDQFMLSICCLASQVSQTDHWLISPELSGNAQTISFWEREITNYYGAETYEIWISSTDNNPSSFTKHQEMSSSVTAWTNRQVSLPAGTKYFAIRHTSDDIYGLMVDDVKYEITHTATVTTAPVSYNVYLDGVLVGSVDADDPLTYTFNNVAPGDHTVEISAVYPGNIESELVPADFTIVPKTDAPEISVATGETAYTITATATDPNATVTLTVDGVEYTGTGSVSVSVDRGNTDQSVYVSATAQEQGKLVSDPNTQYVNVPALPATPTPTITYEQTNAYVVITADGEGTITLSAGGQTVTGEGPISITIMRSLEDQTVPATATAVEPNHQPSEPAYASVPVPALAGDPSVAQEGLLRMHLLVVDQFKEEIPDDNSHPDRYGYVLKWEQPTNVEDHKQSGTVEVDIHKTEAQVNGYYTLSQVENDTDHDNSELIMDVLTADVGMFLPGENPDVLYYQMQSKKDANPALGEDYITQLQYMKNAQKYEEMLATSPNKTHQYPANETYHYYDDSAPLTGDYGVNFMTYAPSVSTWGIQRRYFEEDGLDNTYGAPIWKTGVGQVRMINTEAQLQRGPQGSTQWDGVGGPCSLVFLGLEAFGDLPSIDVSNILYEPYMFRVWIQSPGNNLRGCSLIPEDTTRVDRPGEHWDGDGTCYGAEPILIYQETTTDGHLYLDVQAPPGDNQPWNSRIQFGALDAGVSDLIVYVRFYYRSTGNGISNNNSKYMLRANRDGDEGETPEVPGYYATEDNDNPDVTTGIIEAWNDFYHGEVVSTTYVNVQGMQSDQPFDGVNIVVTRYSDGTTRTTKVVR